MPGSDDENEDADGEIDEHDERDREDDMVCFRFVLLSVLFAPSLIVYRLSGIKSCKHKGRVAMSSTNDWKNSQ